MAQWLIHKLSKLMRISVRTLHHYDRIGLLKPSLRLDNGYRLYSEIDLQRLQQILALKFLGFGLDQIKKVLAAESSSLAHLQLQSDLLLQKAEALLHAREALESAIARCEKRESVDWKIVVHITEVYSMADALRKELYENFLSESQLRDLVEYYAALSRDRKFLDLMHEERVLLEELKVLMADGVDPHSSIGKEWGMRWRAYGTLMGSIPSVHREKAQEVIGTLLYAGFAKRSKQQQQDIVELISKAIRLAVQRSGVKVQLGPDMTVEMMHWILAAYEAAK
ncbi:MAG: hypothetical protein QG604_766 [Candidatus Dependentiae bacterium]|nr:hypothetical protein [Candidatus Dependentiae bacterium]